MSEAEQEMWEAIAQQPPPEEPKIKAGDVVYIEGASAILGDVTAVEESDEWGATMVTVVWRSTETTEDGEELILADDQSKPKPTLPLFESGRPELAKEASAMFGSAA